MLWTSLRFGWGNTGPVILFGLLPLLAATTAPVERHPALPAATIQLRAIEVDSAANRLGADGRITAFESRAPQSVTD